DEEFKHAIELNPNNATAHHWYGHYLMTVGRMDESLTVARRGVEIDPLSSAMNAHLGWAYFYTRQYDRAIEQYRKVIGLDSNFRPAYSWLARIYEQTGMDRQAVAAYQKAMSLSGESEVDVAAFAEAYAKGGIEGAYLWRLERMQAEQEHPSAYLTAEIYAKLGNKDRALAWLERAYDENREAGVSDLNIEPWFDSFRDDPRFQSLLRRLNFPE
ncbi:MAG: tetratricopeptide repeat protein, partial [bacterium]|nr:tetratricopeptide repeat protein [bacterium]